MSKEAKVGLVLSGGGAKGAYQVGVVKGLVELEAQVDAISGASIGALNGAILACSHSLAEGADRLEELWMMLATNSPISAKNPFGALSYLTFLAASGLEVKIALILAEKIANFTGINFPEISNQSVLCDKPLQSLMDKYLNVSGLSKGIPLYISVFESQGGFKDILNVISAETGFSETPDSKFIHVQSLSAAEQKNALLASAALPLLYQSRKIEGRSYTDGGQGGWNRVQGNTPITPLIEAGCNMAIVTHLNDGSLWSRHDFSDTIILEIRPQSSIARDKGFFGGAKDLLGFDKTKIPSWIEQGYQDTLHCVGRVMRATKSRNTLRSSEQILRNSEHENKNSDNLLSDAMSKLQLL